MKKLMTVFLALVSCGSFAEVNFSYQKTVLAKGLDRPWGISHLGGEKFIITERNGDVRILENGQMSAAIDDLPSVYNAGQGGLLDVIADPDYDKNQVVYFTYAAGSATKNATYLIKAKLKGSELSDIETLFVASPFKKQAYHYSGRITFLPDNSMMFAVGDGYFYKDDTQTLDNHFGKVIRINRDGSVPQDNPFVSKAGALPEIYSLGHRNPQGMFYDVKRQLVFSNEHGPQGGDEINVIEPGVNYGWPVITYGVDYGGDIISDLTHKEGMAQPLLQWTPSIAPSSLLVYYGQEFPELNGHILNTTLKYQELRLVELTGAADALKVAGQQTFLKSEGQRIRDIEIDDKGKLYLITDGGEVWQLSKK